jgi:hypothetical protein
MATTLVQDALLPSHYRTNLEYSRSLVASVVVWAGWFVVSSDRWSALLRKTIAHAFVASPACFIEAQY